MKNKKNLRKNPQFIIEKIANLDGESVVVGAVQQITESAIRDGEFAHLGLRIENGKLVHPTEILPPQPRGKFSRRNQVGQVVVRRDLPKVWKTITVEVPNWGGNGTHDVSRTILVYQREFRAPHEATIRIEVIREEQEPERWFLIRFTVNEALQPGTPEFDLRLLWNLNIAWENLSNLDVWRSTATLEESAAEISVGWEILPLGQRPDWIERLLPKDPKNREQVRARILARERLLRSLKPRYFVVGASGFRRYFGALFNDNLVVFENVDYGNALYVMFDGWETLSQLSRTELLYRHQGFERIEHRHGWEERLVNLVNRHRPPPDERKAA